MKLKIKSNELFGYQGYIKQDAPELKIIDYLLYFYNKFEKEQPLKPQLISIEEYLRLSKHNIDKGEEISSIFGHFLGGGSNTFGDTYNEYAEILSQASKAKFYKTLSLKMKMSERFG